MSKYLKYMNTRIWEVVSILEEIFLFNISKYLKYMNTRIWKVFFFFITNIGWPKYSLFMYPDMSKYPKYMNTRIWKVFFILIKNIFILVVHVLNTLNTWIRVFERYSLFWSKIYLFWLSMFWIPQIHEYAYLRGSLYFSENILI